MKKITVKEIRAMLDTLPDDMPVQFNPVTAAFLGTTEPLRFDDIYFYNGDGDLALPSDEDAHLVIYVSEGEKTEIEKAGWEKED